jgi:hypothetical protein
MSVVNDLINGTGGANNPPPAGNGAKEGMKKWRAKRDCIYQKAYVTEGTVVEAAEMKNPHFEAVEEEKD